jgi:bifunctional DNA-binding transcriptional regulator/antitoxin component of YhaV-PrlF toxin-antitoxin module
VNEVYHAKINREGRLCLPAGCRAEAGLKPGQEVLLKVTPDGVLLYTQDQAFKRLQDWCAAHIPPDVSLADELIAERRAEAAKEAGE